jgi:hypothetical protein
LLAKPIRKIWNSHKKVDGKLSHAANDQSLLLELNGLSIRISRSGRLELIQLFINLINTLNDKHCIIDIGHPVGHCPGELTIV